MALGLYVMASGFDLGFGEWHEPGSGFIAVLSGGLLFSLSVLWFGMTLLKKWGREERKKFFKEPDSFKKVLLTLLPLIGFTLILNRVGFMISSFLLLGFLLKAVEPQRWRITILLTLIVTILCVLVFQVWLKVQFPEGPVSLYSIRKWFL